LIAPWRAATRDISRISDSVKTDVRREVVGIGEETVSGARIGCDAKNGAPDYCGIFNSIPMRSVPSLGITSRFAA
jgi:hypothetical protein